MHQLTESVKILQKCAIWSAGKVLLLRRSESATSRPGLWDLPGGNAEWPESEASLTNPHLDDLVREIAEETGFVVNTEDFGLPIHVSSYFDAGKGVYTLILGWKIDLREDVGEPELSDEHSEYVWAAPEDLARYDFGFAGGEDGFIGRMLSA